MICNYEDIDGEIKRIHRLEIAPKLNAGTFPIGIEHRFPLPCNAEMTFVIKPSVLATGLTHATDSSEEVRYTTKIFFQDIKTPLRFEEDSQSEFAHVNSAFEEDNHTKLIIPSGAVSNMATVGSVLGGYFKNEKNHNCAQLIENHINHSK